MADETGLVSVLMPCCGQMEYTRLSVPRVLRHSRPPVELLCIDAGSLDGTADFLDGVAAVAPVPVTLFHSTDEAAFPRLVQEALAAARGALLAWVNNDVLVPEFWLQQLAALATANEKIGVVGPMANLAGEHQRVAAVPYRLARPKERGPLEGRHKDALDTGALDRFAAEHREANRRQWKEVDRLGGFCWLAKREVLQAVPLLETGAEEGTFDERRFAGRVRQAGFHLACCGDLFVHHFGGNLLER